MSPVSTSINIQYSKFSHRAKKRCANRLDGIATAAMDSTTTVSVPDSLITATSEDVAFGKAAHMDPIPIGSMDSDSRIASHGVALVGVAFYRSVRSAVEPI
ncbi:hypothetical protein BCCH1_76910 (plasmid) [Burkholderia contaminans]|uniref:Uncharacterized protein n=1 Tax=Burkholderia contaminans TaxID=488447 RepID=A0A250LKU5_9BURK|nr:hypothetical protein BCCH1_76910 [Burkholderia contaminans]